MKALHLEPGEHGLNAAPAELIWKRFLATRAENSGSGIDAMAESVGLFRRKLQGCRSIGVFGKSTQRWNFVGRTFSGQSEGLLLLSGHPHEDIYSRGNSEALVWGWADRLTWSPYASDGGHQPVADGSIFTPQIEPKIRGGGVFLEGG